MANFNSDFKKILENLEKNIKDKDDLEAARVEIFNMYNIFFDAYTELEEVANSRIAELAQIQLQTCEEVKALKKSLKEIEKDIYMDEECDDEDYDIEIKCPYCNKTFTAEAEDITAEEIICPECNNTIELDWDHDCDCGDDECDGNCSSHGKHHNCHSDDEDDDM